MKKFVLAVVLCWAFAGLSFANRCSDAKRDYSIKKAEADSARSRAYSTQMREKSMKIECNRRLAANPYDSCQAEVDRCSFDAQLEDNHAHHLERSASFALSHVEAVCSSNIIDDSL
jgi:hypothetical protein